MKIPGSVLRWLCTCSLVGMAAILPAAAFAQDGKATGLSAILAGGFLMFFLVFMLAMYVYHSLALQTIADKTGTENGWFAWIPIVQIILMLNIARKPVWWILLFFIPLVNIVVAIIVLMGIAEARNKPNWWGILWIIPPISLVVPGYLAWSD